jgi:hypothetical protein
MRALVLSATLALFALGLAAGPARADVGRVLDDHVLPGVSAFAGATAALAKAARQDCTAVGPAHAAAFDAWMGIAHLNLGPGEGAALGIAFWPDPRGTAPRALRALLAGPLPDDYAQVSAAARGLHALDLMLGEPGLRDYAPGSPGCALVTAIAADLAAQAAALDAAWQDDFAARLRSAGAADNATFLAPDEAVRALYTQLVTGVEFIKDQRVARPLGAFGAPHPARAEAWRTARPQRNILLSLAALRDLARALSDVPMPRSETAFAAALDAAGRLSDPALADLDDPQAWLKLDILRQRLDALQDEIAAELGAALAVGAGFNALDGD